MGIIPFFKRLSKLDNGFLSHAIDQVIGFGVKKDRAPKFVGPKVIVGDPPQAGFDAA